MYSTKSPVTGPGDGAEVNADKGVVSVEPSSHAQPNGEHREWQIKESFGGSIGIQAMCR